MNYMVAVVIGYLLGSIPVSLLVARHYGVDLYRTADGNPGAWNALQQLGARRAWPAFAGDGLKALIAGLAGRALGGWWVGWVAVAAAMIGHALPLFAHGRGGKSVMCFVGGAFALSPPAALICLLVCVLLTVIRGFEWGARGGVFAFPLAQLVTDPVAHVAATGILMALIGVLFAVRRRSPAPASVDLGAPPPT
jgi:acyl phosphate:glycerol-3-phosphate acyltransferase